jgi:hypothetical protein
VIEAWAGISSDFGLSTEEADRLWPDYWAAFSEEMETLGSKRLPDE